jgi:hypothetical protein
VGHSELDHLFHGVLQQRAIKEFHHFGLNTCPGLAVALLPAVDQAHHRITADVGLL